MNIKPDCLVCLYNQALKTTKSLGLDDETSAKILFEVAKTLPNYSLLNTPPQIAKDTYKLIADITGIADPLADIKTQSIKKAKEFMGFLDTQLANSSDKLLTALKIAVGGNVIDFGAKEQFELKDILTEIFDKEFKINHYNQLTHQLQSAKSVVILADNAGENVLDVFLARTIKQLFDVEIYYFVRGYPIINDVTTKEALQSDMPLYATIIDTGVATPGYDLSYANTHSKEIYNNADVVISKGMGNFESLYGITDREVFYLFIIKCNVVAQAIGQQIEDLILM
ncbi:MAG: DUF89 family protein [Epsilonproteobacteria bacterium]|nr:DUF89 family protein [Campylobacterota bacterium]